MKKLLALTIFIVVICVFSIIYEEKKVILNFSEDVLKQNKFENKNLDLRIDHEILADDKESDVRINRHYDKISSHTSQQGSLIVNYLDENKIKCIFDRNDSELLQLENASNGARYHKCYIKKATGHGFDIYFEANGFYERYIPENTKENLVGKLLKDEKKSWTFETIPIENVNEYLFENEIIQFVDGQRRYNHINFAMCEKLISGNENKNQCLFVPTRKDAPPDKKHGVLIPRSHFLSKSNIFWVKFQPSDGRKRVFNMGDISFKIFEKCKNFNSTLQFTCRIILIGDSQSGYDFEAMLYSITRTFGIRVHSLKTYDGGGIDTNFFSENKNKTSIRSVRDAVVEFILPNQSFENNINSTKKFALKSGKIYISHIRQDMGLYDPITHNTDSILLKYLCGIPFKAMRKDRESTIEMLNEEIHAKLIIFNYGIHYNQGDEDLLKKTLESHLNVAQQCKNRGVEVVFRETYAQHFSKNFGGYYRKASTGSSIPEDLPSRAFLPKNETYRECLPSVVQYISGVNWRYDALLNASKSTEPRLETRIVSLDDSKICQGSIGINKLSVIPAFATSSMFWWNHIGKDCTHYFYTPTFYHPYFESLYKIVSFNSKNADKQGCIQVSDEYDFFVEGPSASIVQKNFEEKNHKFNMFYANFKSILEISDSIDQSYLSNLFS